MLGLQRHNQKFLKEYIFVAIKRWDIIYSAMNRASTRQMTGSGQRYELDEIMILYT